jgi:hypothetical protein
MRTGRVPRIQKSHSTDLSSEEIVKGIRRATRKHYSAEDKIRIVLDGLRGEHSIAELCRRERARASPSCSMRCRIDGRIVIVEPKTDPADIRKLRDPPSFPPRPAS